MKNNQTGKANTLPLTPLKKKKVMLANLSVQIPSDLDERLVAQAEKSGLTKNLIARQAVLAAIEMMERDGGLFLPLSFPEKGEQ